MLFKNPHQKENSSLILLPSSQYLPIFLILSTSSSPILSSTTNPLKIASHLIPSYAKPSPLPLLSKLKESLQKKIPSKNPSKTNNHKSQKKKKKKRNNGRYHIVSPT
jgi:hypothetical protein